MSSKNSKAISFSLWRDEEDYKLGAIANAIYAYYTFPEWDCIFYVPEDYDPETISRLDDMDWVHIIKTQKRVKDDDGHILSKFLSASLEYEHLIFRSCRARLIKRDFAAVSEWIDSEKDFHIIHDNPSLGFIPECSWGVRGGVLKNIDQMIYYFMQETIQSPWLKCAKKNEEGQIVFDISISTIFSQQVIFPLSRRSFLRHDETIKNINGEKIGVPIKSPRSFDSAYVGEMITHLETPVKPENRILFYNATTDGQLINTETQTEEDIKDPVEEGYRKVSEINGAL
tara:strand:+ start:1057 stop:1911 length:855 start_codon:yes stop_codon:yes gene_type:complete